MPSPSSGCQRLEGLVSGVRAPALSLKSRGLGAESSLCPLPCPSLTGWVDKADGGRLGILAPGALPSLRQTEPMLLLL